MDENVMREDISEYPLPLTDMKVDRAIWGEENKNGLEDLDQFSRNPDKLITDDEFAAVVEQIWSPS